MSATTRSRPTRSRRSQATRAWSPGTTALQDAPVALHLAPVPTRAALPPPKRHWLRKWLRAHWLSLLVVTWPALRDFTTQVPGDLIADRDQNLWNLWWTGQALARPTNPFETDLLYYPYGAPLYYHTLALPLGLIGLLPLAGMASGGWREPVAARVPAGRGARASAR